MAMIGLGRHTRISYLVRSGHMSNVFAGCAVLDMYTTCGCVDDVLRTFDEMPEKFHLM
jgi:pentatricopeptide repeat protein